MIKSLFKNVVIIINLGFLLWIFFSRTRLSTMARFFAIAFLFFAFAAVALASARLPPTTPVPTTPILAKGEAKLENLDPNKLYKLTITGKSKRMELVCQEPSKGQRLTQLKTVLSTAYSAEDQNIVKVLLQEQRTEAKASTAAAARG